MWVGVNFCPRCNILSEHWLSFSLSVSRQSRFFPGYILIFALYPLRICRKWIDLVFELYDDNIFWESNQSTMRKSSWYGQNNPLCFYKPTVLANLNSYDISAPVQRTVEYSIESFYGYIQKTGRLPINRFLSSFNCWNSFLCTECDTTHLYSFSDLVLEMSELSLITDCGESFMFFCSWTVSSIFGFSSPKGCHT